MDIRCLSIATRYDGKRRGRNMRPAERCGPASIFAFAPTRTRQLKRNYALSSAVRNLTARLSKKVIRINKFSARF